MINVKELSIAFDEQVVVDDVTFSIQDNQILGLVGESGSGKSITALTVMGLLSEQATVLHGSIAIGGEKIVEQLEENHNAKDNYIDKKNLRNLQGKTLSMIFQEPMTSLNPTMKIGAQIEEVLKIHTTMQKLARRQLVIKTLEDVGLNDAERVYDSYPHELSGGMRQRVMIAMAIILKPQILIADEPTTALDVTIQAQICELLRKISVEYKISILFITHDLNLAKKFCSDIIVMNHGRIVEQGTSEAIFEHPVQQYTKKLINAIPARVKRKRAVVEAAQLKDESQKILAVDHLNVFYTQKNKHIFEGKQLQQVVCDANFTIQSGEIMGLVGESGCGKSSLSKAILGINQNITGNIQHFSEKPQMIFQDPYSSLNPAKTIGWIMEEPLRIEKKLSSAERKADAIEMLRKVGLDEQYYFRKPGELSGGQRQRVSIGQALISKPKFVIADEPVSALDVTIQAQIMDLMLALQEEMNLSYLFISHDINVIYQMCDKLMIMQNGRIIESGSAKDVFAHPKNAYTQTLLQ